VQAGVVGSAFDGNTGKTKIVLYLDPEPRLGPMV